MFTNSKTFENALIFSFLQQDSAVVQAIAYEEWLREFFPVEVARHEQAYNDKFEELVDVPGFTGSDLAVHSAQTWAQAAADKESPMPSDAYDSTRGTSVQEAFDTAADVQEAFGNLDDISELGSCDSHSECSYLHLPDSYCKNCGRNWVTRCYIGDDRCYYCPSPKQHSTPDSSFIESESQDEVPELFHPEMRERFAEIDKPILAQMDEEHMTDEEECFE